MRILVTGAKGYIGKHVCAKLSEKHDVLPADLPEVNVLSNDFSLEVFGGLDCVLHLAWQDGFAHNSQAHMENLSKHFMFCKHTIDAGIKLVVMGSMHEVGYWEGPVDENTPCNPMSMYGIAKDALRRAVLLYAKGGPVLWLRGYYIFGDEKHSNSIFGKISLAASEGKKTFPFTSGRNKYDFISVDDLAVQIAACISQNEVSGIINCCTGMPKTLSEQVEWFIALHSYDIKLDYGVFPDRPYDSPGIWGDNSKIVQIISKFTINK